MMRRELRPGDLRQQSQDNRPILGWSKSIKPDFSPLTKKRGVRRRLGGSVGDTSNRSSDNGRHTSSHHSYVRIRPSSKTGGYVGSVDSSQNFGYYCDDSTMGAANTVQSSPELFARARRQENPQATTRRREARQQFQAGDFPQQQARLQPIQSSNKHISFLERWKKISRGKVVASTNSSTRLRTGHVATANISSGAAATSPAVSGSSSNESAALVSLKPLRGVSNSVTTPIRRNTAPRFILPDETPPSPTTTRPLRPKASGSLSSQDQTSAGAVVHTSVEERHQGFEMTIEADSAPPLPDLSPQTLPAASNFVRRTSNPVDLDDSYNSGDEGESLVRSWVNKLALTNEKLLLVETCCSGAVYTVDDEPNIYDQHAESDGDVASIVANPTLPPDQSDIETASVSPTKPSHNVFPSVGSSLFPKRAQANHPSEQEENDEDLVEDDVTEFSLAPLHKTQHRDITTVASKVPPPSKIGTRKRFRAPTTLVSSRRNGLGSIFPRLRRKETTSMTAVALLERERLAAMESETKRLFLERQEALRIERKRREYLNVQRARERNQPQNVSAAQRDSIFVSMELVEQDSHKNRDSNDARHKHRRRQQETGTTLTQSTAPTTATSKVSSSVVGAVITIPACVVCRAEHRTHIATPCMHFAYCGKCAQRLSTSCRGCFVCGRPNVTFAAVSV